MNGLPKGLQLEASVTVAVANKVELVRAVVEPETIGRGETLEITYEIECSDNVSFPTWLGASFLDKNGKQFNNRNQDRSVTLTKGKNTRTRQFTIAVDAPLGEHMLGVNVWRGIPGDSSCKVIAPGTPVPIKISE